MTRLTGVTVEGFKGIDRIEFNPGSLNVVTGRNNSGKTSLLEALQLSYDPSTIARFGPNLDTLINHQFRRGIIKAETTETVRNLSLSSSNEDAIPEYLATAFQEHLVAEWKSAQEEVSDDQIKEIVDDKLSKAIGNLTGSSRLTEISEETVVIEVNDEIYPYIYYGPEIGELYSYIDNETRDTIQRSVAEESEEAQTLKLKVPLWSSPTDGEFVNEGPSSLGSTKFVDFTQSASSLTFDTDDADPVKVDNIGDFLREKGIVDDLKTFDVDHLVFEPDEGNKYSVPFEFMGEGFKTIVGVLWELMDEEEEWDIVLLEEPETHMHPGYVRELVYFLVELTREEGVQLFVTTHNNDFLNDFFDANFSDEEWNFLKEEFRLLQLQDGTADVMNYSEAKEDLRDLKLDLRGL